MAAAAYPSRGLVLRNGDDASLSDLPVLKPEDFTAWVLDGRARGGRLAQLFGRRAHDGGVTVYAFVAYDADGVVEVSATHLGAAHGFGRLEYPSISEQWPAAQAFERELAEQYGVTPLGHPWLKPLRYHATDTGAPAPWGPFDANKVIPGDYPFYRVEGDEVHEVAVGPVHAGVIEPGHFRFQCHGEDVLHLEIMLGYQHRGAEKLLVHPNRTRGAIVAETIAGDTSIGHATAYCMALEALAGVAVSARAHAIRGIALELERLANHVGDLGALCNDVAFLPGASYLGRLRGDFLNLTLEICGNRFGRNLVRPGGTAFDISPSLSDTLRKRLEALQPEVLDVLDMMFSQSSVLARFEGTGALSEQQADEIGLVGPAARACGCTRDVRQDFPFGMFQFSHIPVANETTGDVYARAVVRWLEVQRSIEFLLEHMGTKPAGGTFAPMRTFRPNALAIAMCETWRGEAMHVAFTNAAGDLDFVKVKDPSIHNWFGLALAMRGTPISDFPLCNKSFNLSYAGHDL
ncbi:MAG: NADH-quinone oxidoreductase subunit C [Candidatus Hydrogenedentes bacterium]|nr:NADH-quinone oxidoreductase subunit C [Candidatus Hydrogenedentota bacterium]